MPAIPRGGPPRGDHRPHGQSCSNGPLALPNGDRTTSIGSRCRFLVSRSEERSDDQRRRNNYEDAHRVNAKSTTTGRPRARGADAGRARLGARRVRSVGIRHVASLLRLRVERESSHSCSRFVIQQCPRAPLPWRVCVPPPQCEVQGRIIRPAFSCPRRTCPSRRTRTSLRNHACAV